MFQEAGILTYSTNLIATPALLEDVSVDNVTLVDRRENRVEAKVELLNIFTKCHNRAAIFD
jgi:hypothetical protein